MNRVNTIVKVEERQLLQAEREWCEHQQLNGLRCINSRGKLCV